MLLCEKILFREGYLLSRCGSDQHAGYARLADYVPGCIGAQVCDCLLSHVVHVTHVVLEVGDAPPETECVSEAGGALSVERRGNRAMCFYSSELDRIEVSRIVELRDLCIECGECAAEVFR